VGAEAGQKPDSEGPWTKAGVIIAAASGLLGLILAYVRLAAIIHWVPSPGRTQHFRDSRPGCNGFCHGVAGAWE
jgi:hypothetical protein